MKRKTIAGFSVILAFLLVGGSVLLAQRNETNKTVVRPKTRATYVWNFNDGRPRLGVQLADVTAGDECELKLSGESGAVVKEVEAGSAAAKAGLAANDVILEFDGERVRSVAELRRLVQDTPSGRIVAVKISRAGQMRTLNVKLDAENSQQESAETLVRPFDVPEIHLPNFNFEFFGGGPRLGVSADELTPQLATYFGVSQGKGVLVLEVTPGSAAERAGLKAGDCIVRVGSETVGSVAELHRALGSGTDEKREVSLTIVRDRREQTVQVQLEPAQRLMQGRVAQDGFIGIDPSELTRLRERFQASSIALQTARQELENRRLNLTGEKQRMLNNLRRELGDTI